MTQPRVPGPWTVIGVPIDSVGLGRDEAHGTERSPDALRGAGLGRLGWDDLGDLDVRIPDHDRDPSSGVVGIGGVLETTDRLRAATRDLVAAGRRPFVLGGCCTLLPGVLAGVRDALGSVGLVYVDGHLDIYDGSTSPTGEGADMPVAVTLGDGPPAWVERVAPVPVVAPSALAVLGYHDPEELADVGHLLPARRAAGWLDVDAATIQRDGAASVGRAAVEHAGRDGRPIWFHVDLDVLDQAVFPATDYLMDGGLDWPALIELARPALTAPGLVGWSLSCYNPEKDPDGRDGRAIIAAMDAWFGGPDGPAERGSG